MRGEQRPDRALDPVAGACGAVSPALTPARGPAPAGIFGWPSGSRTLPGGFRERYDARQILSRLVGDVRRVGSFDGVAVRVTAATEAALHPEFAAIWRATSL